MRIIVLFFISLSVIAEVENSIKLTQNIYENDNNLTSINYQIKGFNDIGENGFFYYNTEFLVNNAEDNLVNPIEFKYQLEQDDYNLIFGFDTIFWGVAESYNPVDIINRPNLLTTSDNKDKLGELIIGGSYFIDDIALSGYILPKFYHQEFLGKDSYSGIDINSHIIEDEKTSYTLRYKQIIDNIDLGVSYFNGVSRKHNLIPNNTQFNIIYPDLEQLGIDTQLTTENALYKLEYASKSFSNKNNYDLVTGIEYMFIADIAINGLIEYLKSNDNIIYQNDIMLGLRFDLENEDGTEGIISFIYDRDYYSKILNLNGSTRINDNLKLEANLSFYDINDNDLLLKTVKNNFGLSLNYYF